MNDDDELCLCFHVTKRKVVQYIRARRPRVASQLSECYGAGTGCGWCRPFLRRLLETSGQDDTPPPSGSAEVTPKTPQPPPPSSAYPDAASYAAARAQYRQEKNQNE